MLKEKYILLLHKKLSGQISLSEASALKAWREKHPEEDLQLTEIEQLWDLSEDYAPMPDLDLDQAKDSFFKAISTQKTVTEEKTRTAHVYQLNREAQPKNLWFRLVGVAAAVVVILIGAYFVFLTERSQSVPEFMSGESLVGMHATNSDLAETLKDGTKLWLKKGSFFSYDPEFNETNRNVYLHGELFIHVVSNTQLPFKIFMAENQLEVLGTAFYLKSDKDNDVELKVEDGRVLISSENEEKILVAGEEIFYNRDIDEFESPHQNPVVNNWRSSYLIFDNVPLHTVFNKLSIFYGVDFKIECDRINELKGFTSLIQIQENPKLQTYIQTLEKVYGIQIDVIDSDTFRVYGDPCK